MTWAKIDDRANEHRKLLAAGAEAAWFWACGLMYANRQRARDGFIPDIALPLLYPVRRPRRLADKLVTVGLWDRDESSTDPRQHGYRIHDFGEWNRSAEQVEADKAAARSRASRSYGLKKSRGSAVSAHADTNEPAHAESPQSIGADKTQNHDSSGSTPLPLPLPLPRREREAPTAPARTARPRGGVATRLADDWMPSPEQIQKLRSDFGVDPIPAIRRFRNHFVGMADANKNAKKSRWDLAFENWVERDAGDGKLPKLSPAEDFSSLPLIRAVGREALIPPADDADAPNLAGAAEHLLGVNLGGRQ